MSDHLRNEDSGRLARAHQDRACDLWAEAHGGAARGSDRGRPRNDGEAEGGKRQVMDTMWYSCLSALVARRRQPSSPRSARGGRPCSPTPSERNQANHDRGRGLDQRRGLSPGTGCRSKAESTEGGPLPVPESTSLLRKLSIFPIGVWLGKILTPGSHRATFKLCRAPNPASTA
jgi:hypothetical protein